MAKSEFLDLLPVGAVARQLGLSAQRVRTLIDEGYLPAVVTQLGRLVDPADVELFRHRRDPFGRYRVSSSRAAEAEAAATAGSAASP